MLIEFQNCSLSIGYIGTPQEIAIAKRVDAIGIVAESIRSTFQEIYDACEKTAEQILAGMPPGSL